MRRGWEVGRLAGDRPPGSGGEAENGLRGAERGHPGGVVGACLGLGLGGFAVWHGQRGGFGAEDDGVLHFDRERGGAGGFAGGGPLDLEEGADYGGGGCECGLEGDGVEIEHSGGGEGEKIGVCVGGFERGREGRAGGCWHGGPALHEDDIKGEGVAALERERGESGGRCRAFYEPPRCDINE